MTESRRSVSKDDAVKVLRHAGIPATRINEILEQLPDPIDVDRAEPIFARYGVTRDELMDRLGGSP